MLRRSVLDGETIYFYRQGKGEPCLGTLDGYRPVTRFSVGEVAEKVAGDTVKQPVHEWLADHLHRIEHCRNLSGTYEFVPPGLAHMLKP